MIGPATVRERWPAFLGSFVAVALGVAMVAMSALVLLSDGARVPDRLAGAPVLVRSPAGTPAGGVFVENPPWSPERAERLRRELAGLPGVAAAVADRSFYAQATGTEQREGERQGHPWSAAALASYGLSAGRAPATADEIVVDESLGHAPGETVTVLTARGPRRFWVSGTTDGPGYHVTDRRAAELSGGVRTIGLLLDPGADSGRVETAVRRAVGGDGTVLTGAARDALAPKRDEMTRWIGGQVLTAMALLSAFVTVFVVASAFAFTVAQRRREFGLLRTIGATPRQVRRMVYGEALVVGAAGAAVGALLGVVLAPALTGLLIDAGFQPAGFEVRLRWWVPAGAFAVGPVVALLGAGAASRRASRVRPLEAMREAVVDSRPMTRRRWITGLAATALGAACSVGTAFSGADGMVLLTLGTAMGLTTGLTLLLPALVGPVIGALTRPLARRPGATALLVRENMITAVRRTAATVAPVLATVAFAVLITSSVQTTRSADIAQRAAAVRAEAAVVPRGTPGLSDAAVARVEGTAPLSTTVYGGDGRAALSAAGVTADFGRAYGVPVPRDGTVGVGADGTTADAAGHATGDATGDAAGDGADALAVTAAASVSVSASPAADGTAVVTAAVAAAHGWREGRTAEVTFEDGRTSHLRVGAVVDDSAVPYQLLLPRDLVRAHDPSALADVAYRTGPDPARLPGALGAEEVSVEAYAASDDAEEERLVRIFTLILVAMSAGYTAIAVASTLLTATTGRVRDLRVLRLTGATSRQILRALAAETCCVVALGAALGLAVAAPALLGTVHGLREEAGLPVEPRVAWPWLAGTVAACLLLGTAATVLPARAALRRMRRT
ncbi:ABC transporter permease [Streptomyces sp. DH41]|uniref:ABC transporter permease n=1 Tax=Streptomyces sp. DH41 TaxID=3040125 RepID=UPI002442464E|nr:ABC transporter permease [Streptomyces sp. DH41]MDG9728546.1 ABC transporter permease [Streptomyces sp. DH41]